jgi:hypothetical protein
MAMRLLFLVTATEIVPNIEPVNRGALALEVARIIHWRRESAPTIRRSMRHIYLTGHIDPGCMDALVLGQRYTVSWI